MAVFIKGSRRKHLVFMAKRISQEQIAKELGVSQPLVSLVLNGRRENVSDESYKMIWAMAVKQGYVPRGGMQPIHAPDVQHSYVGVVMRSGMAPAGQNNTFGHVNHGLFKALQHLNISTAFLGGEGELDEKRLFDFDEPTRSVAGNCRFRRG